MNKIQLLEEKITRNEIWCNSLKEGKILWEIKDMANFISFQRELFIDFIEYVFEDGENSKQYAERIIKSLK